MVVEQEEDVNRALYLLGGRKCPREISWQPIVIPLGVDSVTPGTNVKDQAEQEYSPKKPHNAISAQSAFCPSC
jgi:hypothetical protein